MTVMGLGPPGFLGRGWNFPVRHDGRCRDGRCLDESCQIQLVPDAEEGIRQSIWMILSTAPGERVMRPDFGCSIHDLVFRINDARTAGAVAAAVRAALALWEPRIDVLDVYAAPDPSRPDRLLAEINYQVRATNSRFNLVYPFYLE
jgi:Bacteriophage baseplate protein W